MWCYPLQGGGKVLPTKVNGDEDNTEISNW